MRAWVGLDQPITSRPNCLLLAWEGGQDVGVGLALFKGKATRLVKHLILRTWALPSGMRGKNGGVGKGNSELSHVQHPCPCKDRIH